MITHLNGKLAEKNPTNIVVECNGVGYFVNISLNTFSGLGSNEAIRIYTKLIVREDAHVLYGFATTEERAMFEHLISVSGIGPNTAMIMLSSLVPDEIAQAIMSEDVPTIQKIKGIPDGHFFLVKRKVLPSFFHDKIIGLVSMVQPVKFTNSVSCRFFIVPV